MARTRFALAATLAAAFTLGAATIAPAQDKPKDDALDRLLEKAEGKAPAPAEPAPKPKPKPDDQDKAKAKPADKPKAKAEAEPKDKALDGLLEKLGETKEAPKTTGPAGGAPDSADKPAAKPDDVTAGRLKEGEKPLDEHLERLTGRAQRKKSQQGKEGQDGQQGDGSDENTPIGRAVKKMRQVETKLGQDDTGDETRKTQGEIVKDLDTLIAQAKKQQQQMQMKKGQRKRPGSPQDGPPMGDQPGAQGDNAQGAKPMKTTDAKSTSALAGDKNTWGNLPAMLREEMDNVFKSEPLPAKAERIGRYYKAVAKKGMSSSSGG